MLIFDAPNETPGIAFLVSGLLMLLANAYLWIAITCCIIGLGLGFTRGKIKQDFVQTNKEFVFVNALFLAATLVMNNGYFGPTDAEFANNLSAVGGLRIGILWMIFYCVYKASAKILATHRSNTDLARAS